MSKHITDTEKKLQAAIDKVNTAFSDNSCGFSAEVNLNTKIVSIDIEWGDWKHEHNFADYIMSLNGFTKVSERIYEEDGSDCYSAVHYYVFDK